jgi:peptide/nickel transport system substrate-binding protein
MNKNIHISLIISVFITLISCTSSDYSKSDSQINDERRHTVILDIEGGRVINPQMWNPFLPGVRKDQGFHQCMIEPLFMLNFQSGEIEPWLALSMTPNDSMTEWLLKLRPGVAWSDGVPFTSEDITYTINLLKANSPILSWSAKVSETVDTVIKQDSLTVLFKLKKSDPRFKLDMWSVRIAGSCPILPAHIFRGQDIMSFKNYDQEKGWPVFTGPYKLKSVSQTEFIYERNNDWWGTKAGFKPLPKPRWLKWVWYGPEETRTAAMASHKLDALGDISLGAFLALKRKNRDVIAWLEDFPYASIDPCVRNLEFNCAKAPWNDKDMRWAVNYSLDRNLIISVAYEGTSFPATTFFPLYPPMEKYIGMAAKTEYYQTCPLVSYDPKKAKMIIESKGYRINENGYYEKDGEELSMTLTAPENSIEIIRIAQIVVEQLHNVGINATSRVEGSGVYFENFSFGRFEGCIGWSTCASVNEPISSMDFFSSRWVVPIEIRANANGWRWKNEEYSRLVDDMKTLPLNDPRSDSLYIKAISIWLEDLPVIPLTQAKKLIPFDTKYWKGWPTAKNNYFQPFSWWNSSHRIIHNLEPVTP